MPRAKKTDKVYAPRIRWRDHYEQLAKWCAEGKSVAEIAVLMNAKPSATSKGILSLGLRIDQEALLERKRANMRRIHRDEDGSHAAAMRTPEHRALRRAIALRLYQDPAFVAKTSAARKAVCDNEAFQAKLKKALQAGRERAKARRQAAKAEKAMLDAMTPFERQLWLVRHGKAQLVHVAPIRKRNDNGQTLGGVSEYGGL